MVNGAGAGCSRLPQCPRFCFLRRRSLFQKVRGGWPEKAVIDKPCGCLNVWVVGSAARVLRDFKTASATQSNLPLLKLLTAEGMARILVLGMVLVVLQQWCGINVIFNYAQEIFAAAGYRVSDILFNIVITGAVNVVFTLIALGTIDRLAGDSCCSRESPGCLLSTLFWVRYTISTSRASQC